MRLRTSENKDEVNDGAANYKILSGHKILQLRGREPLMVSVSSVVKFKTLVNLIFIQTSVVYVNTLRSPLVEPHGLIRCNLKISGFDQLIYSYLNPYDYFV